MCVLLKRDLMMGSVRGGGLAKGWRLISAVQFASNVREVEMREEGSGAKTT
jgi:hypothetical protein